MLAGELCELTGVLDTIIRQNENTLEQLNQYRVCVENIQKSRKEKQEVEQQTPPSSLAERKPRSAGRTISILLHSWLFSVQCQTEGGLEMTEGETELERIYSRIRELESSIVTLGQIWTSTVSRTGVRSFLFR